MIIPRDLITVKFHEGRPFLKIFYQFTNVSSDYFHENDDFEYINEKNKFSIIKYINLQFKYNGCYEFLLEYPSVEGYNRWKQRLFPTETDEGLKNFLITNIWGVVSPPKNFLIIE